MRLLTGTDIVDFHNGRDDLLVLTEAGEFVTLDHADLTDRTDAYGLTTTHDDVVVTVLLERDTIDGGDWFPDALDDNGDLNPEAADEMAAIINNDAGLHARAAVQEIRNITAAWEQATAEADRLAAERARRIAQFAQTCGSQSAAARLLGIDQSTVNKLVKKAQTA
jgi:transcriptional regulator with GAF, ATPase, and Fis domain